MKASLPDPSPQRNYLHLEKLVSSMSTTRPKESPDDRERGGRPGRAVPGSARGTGPQRPGRRGGRGAPGPRPAGGGGRGGGGPPVSAAVPARDRRPAGRAARRDHRGVEL